jgi:hypothetical protein
MANCRPIKGLYLPTMDEGWKVIAGLSSIALLLF